MATSGDSPDQDQTRVKLVLIYSECFYGCFQNCDIHLQWIAFFRVATATLAGEGGLGDMVTYFVIISSFTFYGHRLIIPIVLSMRQVVMIIR